MSVNKTAKQEAPHAIYLDRQRGWEYRVLKVNMRDSKKEMANPYASWMCAVQSPHTHGGWDMGDTYVRDVRGSATLVAATPEWLAHYGIKNPVPTPAAYMADVEAYLKAVRKVFRG